MDFVKLYKAANVNEAYFIKGLLSESGIKIQLLGEGLSVAMGGLPLEVIEVDILVSKYQFDEAKKIFGSMGSPTIDTTRRSVEETAAAIMNIRTQG